MLSPRYLDGLSDELVEIYSQLETDILQDMARRVKRLGKITDATKWQAQMLAEAGGLKANIGKTLKNYDKRIIAEVTRTYTEALRKSTENDNKIFIKALGRTVSEPNAQQMLATIQKCHSDLSRLTLTTAATSETLFVQQANRVYLDTQSGAFDYDTAMKSAADAMAERGITTVQYRNGTPVTLSIEHAIRMNILTSINQTAANMTLNNCEELGCDLVETSAHIGARPEHEEWQGQIFSRSGNNPKYRPFSVCELGSVTGICGINCRHSFYPYFEGMHEHYTQDDLDEMASEKVTYNGKEMTRYEGEQAQRKIERQIRYYKRRALTEEAAGADNTAARVKLGEWQAKARDFTQQTGLLRDPAREYIGTKDGVQPRGVKIPTFWQRPYIENNTKIPSFTGGFVTGYKNMSIPEKQSAVENWLIRKGIESRKERLVITDSKGNILGINKGQQSHVDPSKRILKILGKSADNSINFFHNHPSNGSFSLKDIISTIKLPSIKNIYAIGHDGSKYMLDISKNRCIISDDELKRFWRNSKKLENKIFTHYIDKSYSGKITEEQAYKFAADKFVEIIARTHKWEYERSIVWEK